MREIQGKARTIRELLKGVKYSIDYYQREYKWEDRHVRDLIEDMVGKFLYDQLIQRSYDSSYSTRLPAQTRQHGGLCSLGRD